MGEITVLYVAGPAGPDPPAALTDHPDTSVERVETAAAARDRVESAPPDCVVAAYHLPDGTGASLAAAVRSAVADIPVVLYSEADRTEVQRDDAATVVEFVDAAAGNAEQRLVQLVAVAARRHCHAPYPVPGDEDDRLAVLPTVDGDERVETALDRLARLAALYFDAEYGAVNVVEKRVVTALGQYGGAPRQYPREASACTYTILEDGATVVPDMRDDPRFAGYDAVADLELGFYAGVPVDVGGLPVATVCVYDTDARAFVPDDDDERFLETLAAGASEWLSAPPTRGVETTATARGRSE